MGGGAPWGGEVLSGPVMGLGRAWCSQQSPQRPRQHPRSVWRLLWALQDDSHLHLSPVFLIDNTGCLFTAPPSLC